MATVVAVMDRDTWDARTDNIVVVDPSRRRLVWIPRDLWSHAAGDRINTAYRQGGHDLLSNALREHGFPVDSSLVLLRSAVERVLGGLHVTVPVDRRRRYWYPLEPTADLEDGRKLVCFEPPAEELSGERIHQWIGARQSADTPPLRLPDVDRIERQQVLVGVLLSSGFDFSKALADAALVSRAGSSHLDDLAAVRPQWELSTLAPVQPVTIEGKRVLVRGRSRVAAVRARWPRVRR